MSLCGTELDISKEITCKWQNQNVLSNYAYMYKHNIKCYKMLKWQKWTLKNYLCIRTQKVCPSMPSFVSAVLFIPSFNALSCYFYDSLNLVAVPTAWILINFVTLLLYNVNSPYIYYKQFSTAQLFGGFNSIYSIFQTLQRKLFQRKCKPITMSEEPHKIYNLVNNQKINIIEKLCHLQFPFFCFFFLKTIDPCFFNTWLVNIHVSAGKTIDGWFASCGNIVWIS